MTETDKKEEITAQSDQEEIKRIKLTRHLWPDEVEKKKSEKTIRRLRIGVVVLGVLGLLAGWIGGSFLPIPGANRPTINVTQLVPMDTKEKISSILGILENVWFFSKDIDNLGDRLTDQALIGITTNPEDIHTSYMTKEEMESFTQGINRNFVGIGVQYISVEEANIITSVFKDSPAEKAGVLAGDVIKAVDGIDLSGKTTDDIKDLVTGESGTKVVLSVERQGQEMDIPIIRGEILATISGEILDEETGYLNMVQFGDSTANEMDKYLAEFDENGIENLIIDLRENGGGYLTSLQGVAGRFLEKGTLIIQEEDKDGNISKTISKGENLHTFKNIILLISDSTASAAEAFTISMKENLDCVTTVGITTYGKGTVQTNRYFSDGSALKVTSSRWLSPSGVWINEKGIDPDIEIQDHQALQIGWVGMEEDEVLEYDSVGEAVKCAQNGLDYLGYTPDRTDGYFSRDTEEKIRQFQSDHELTADGKLNQKTYLSIYSAIVYEISFNKEKDAQLQKALEIIHEES